MDVARSNDMETALPEGGEEGREPLRVVIAEDDALARRTIRDALQEAGCIVAADASNGREAVELTLYYRPDVVLLDLLMPELDGIAATRQISERAPEVKIVILSTSEDDDLALLALRMGASGYLTKDVDLVRLPSILRAVASGEAAVTRIFTAKLIAYLRTIPHAGFGMRPVRSDLTAREWEVLDLLAAGLDPEQIASELVISAETIRSHEKSLRRKLEVHSRVELIKAVRNLRTPAVPSGRPERDARD